MQIKIYPEELVKCGIWDSYAYYVIGDDKKSQNILIENKEFEISSKDALVIGLLKVIETPNLIHRFNQFLTDFLNIKSQRQGNLLLVRKKGIILATDKFLNKYPDYWTPDAMYEKGLIDLVNYINEFKDGVEELEIHKITDQFGTHEFINSSYVKKLLSFNY
jgi:hypothetical protein